MFPSLLAPVQDITVCLDRKLYLVETEKGKGK